MEWRDIEYFAVVAEHGHLGRAANALRLSQPALSKSLGRLEQDLQVKLVKRTPKGIALTAEGSVLLLRVRDLRLSLQNLRREIMDVGEGRVGLARVGVGFPGPEQFLSAAFAMLLEDAPRTKLVVSHSDNDLMIPALHNGELDLIVHYLPRASSSAHSDEAVRPIEGLVCEHLFDDEFVVCASTKHRLAGRKKVPISELAQERWLSTDPALRGHQRLHEVFLNHGLPPPSIAMEARATALRLRTVASSNLVDWTSRKSIEQSAVVSSLAILPVKELAWVRPVGLIYRRETYQSPAIKRLIEILKEATREMLK
jgi:DNA-binding transcriptional LysR family regulator